MEQSMEARVGRAKQRYAEDGARIVAGGIVHHPSGNGQVLVVSSEARPDHWIIPKGGAETDETIEEAALREVWEESGAVAKVKSFVGILIDSRPPKHWKADGRPAPPRTAFHIFEMSLEQLKDKWPEHKTRRRTWMAYEEAHAAMLAHDRVQLAEALEQSSLGPAKKNGH